MTSPSIHRALVEIYYDIAEYEDVQWLEEHEIYKLASLAIYFHANKCFEKIYYFLINKEYSLYEQFEIAALCDNVWFFQKYRKEYFGCSLSFMKMRILAIAEKNKSQNVVSYINEIDKGIDTSFWNDKDPKVHSKIIEHAMKTKSVMDTLSESWIMETSVYDNLTQWLPKELLEEQLLDIFLELERVI